MDSFRSRTRVGRCERKTQKDLLSSSSPVGSSLPGPFAFFYRRTRDPEPFGLTHSAADQSGTLRQENTEDLLSSSSPVGSSSPGPFALFYRRARDQEPVSSIRKLTKSRMCFRQQKVPVSSYPPVIFWGRVVPGCVRALATHGETRRSMQVLPVRKTLDAYWSLNSCRSNRVL